MERPDADMMYGFSFKKKISRNFILILLATLVVCQGALWVWVLHMQKTSHGRDLESRVRGVSLLLSGVASQAFTASDFGDIDHAFQSLPDSDKNIISVRALDANGTTISQRQLRGEPENQGKGGFFFLPATGTLSTPVISASGGREGSIEVHYSAADANSQIRRALLIFPLAQMSVLVLIAFIAFYFFQRKIGYPINGINQKLGALAKGDLTVEIEAGGADEMGSITEGLRHLKENLGITIAQLSQSSSDVGMAIRQISKVFSSVNTGVQEQGSAVSDIFMALQKAGEFQDSVKSGTEELLEFSSENVTSLLEVRATADEIAASTGKLFQAVDDSYAAVEELTAAAGKISENAQNALSSIEQTSASVEEVGSSVKEIEKGAAESSKLADQVRKAAAEEGVIVVAEAIEKMEQIAEKIKFSSDIVSRLGTRSKDIGGILSIIRNVTEQTNLLSLNAAILAAQAGEYGKGFSVVADEIHALSERTAASTKEIEGIVKTISKEISQTVDSIGQMLLLLESGMEIFYKAGTSTAGIVTAAQDSAKMAHTIQRATEEQGRALQQITLAVEHIRDMVFEMARATGEQSKGTGFLLDKMSEVREIAEATKMGTYGQAQGTKHISENLETANERISGMKKIIDKQQQSSKEVVSSVEQIQVIGLRTLRDTEEISYSLTTLQAEVEALSREVQKFRLNGKVHNIQAK
ncbi:MAG: methyl-accepting chemotaxis protein [Actinomycetota bacterium]|nr:methyl-accepting chemotaxis protein [Actinomycetota bacterium]